MNVIVSPCFFLIGTSLRSSFLRCECEHNDFPPHAKLGQTTRRGKDSFEMGVDGEPWRLKQQAEGVLSSSFNKKGQEMRHTPM